MAVQEAGQYDVVTCMEMLEHVPDPGAILHACAALLRPGGRLFVSTINRTPAAFALAIVGAEYVARLLPKGTHQYREFIEICSRDSMARLPISDAMESLNVSVATGVALFEAVRQRGAAP